MKKTPLYEIHAALGARMIDFGGWMMPVQYSTVIEEHKAARRKAGLFDICHMGEIEIRGPASLDFLQFVITRNLQGQAPGQMKLSVLANESGGILDDLTVYKFSDTRFLLVTNAVTRQKDFDWLTAKRAEKRFDVQIEDVSDRTGKLDLQGPAAQQILKNAAQAGLESLRYYHFLESEVLGIPALVSRSGYTGEDGFEIYADSSQIAVLWEGLLEIGRPLGLKPIGLGARDTLRLEAGLMLYGNEMNEQITPLEVEYGWVVNLEKDFVGSDALRKQKEQGVRKRLVGFELLDRGIARHDYTICKGEKILGKVTSGTFAPTINKPIGMGFVPTEFASPGTEIEIRIRENTARARVTKLPFYQRKKN